MFCVVHIPHWHPQTLLNLPPIDSPQNSHYVRQTFCMPSIPNESMVKSCQITPLPIFAMASLHRQGILRTQFAKLLRPWPTSIDFDFQCSNQKKKNYIYVLRVCNAHTKIYFFYIFVGNESKNKIFFFWSKRKWFWKFFFFVFLFCMSKVMPPVHRW